jgi:hypothetical protein
MNVRTRVTMRKIILLRTRNKFISVKIDRQAEAKDGPFFLDDGRISDSW